MTLKENWVLRIVLTIKLFFHTFCETILMYLVIMSCSCSHLNKSTVSCFCGAFNIPLSAILCWSSVSRMDTHLDWPDDHPCSWHTWTCEDKALLSWFPVKVGWSCCSPCNTIQIADGVPTCEIYCIWHIWSLGSCRILLYDPNSCSFYTEEYLGSYLLYELLQWRFQCWSICWSNLWS